jgi:Effector-associated domain 10
MSTDDHLQAIINRIANKQHTEEDITLLQRLVTDNPQIASQLGKNIVNIGEGKEIHIGDRIYYQWDKEAVKALVEAIRQPTSYIRSQFKSLIDDKTKDFVGREYVFDAINAFIANNPKGYFTIIGDPGQGKSAILAKYVQDTGCIAHFNQLLQGPNRADQFLESICRQLVERYQLPYDPLPNNAKQDGEFLSQLLDEVAQQRKGEKIIISVDALDEVDINSYRDAANILYLPAHLPDGVYFILTRRRDVEVPLTSYAPMQTISLLDYQTDSQRDVRTYIGNRVNSSENLRQRVDVRGETIIEFTDKIALKSDNNFMYLRYVLIDIESGLYQDLTLEQFPQGLQSYYDFHWRRMGMNDEPLPLEKIRIIVILGAVKEPVSQRKVCDYSGEKPLIVQNILFKWKQFLHELLKDDEKRYIIYHSSYRDFLHSLTEKNYPVTFKEIHKRIAKVELKVWNKVKEVLKNRRHE